ncbi:uncharacterized protein LOC132701933 isoform X2 [Cylas formicarius]|uniref:uncharacterized protein LOC132701933 isoform X2 n=1 Tax=Cylas formicarius TaxID=197179 RepID=UPI0029588CE0|nr:uncharacterized protein LOC132701933 isoform X2 [Cylas formicarius]
MIFVFHCLNLLIYRLFKNIVRLKKLDVSLTAGEYEVEYELKFDPPVFKQRYEKVYHILIDERWRTKIRKLVDFGCAEFGMFIFLRSLSIEEMFLIDIDEVLLEEKVFRIEPMISDHLIRRNRPLEVSVFAGSVSDPDYRLRNTTVVTAIELIEHLYPDTLDAFPYNVFSFIEPKIVIVSTPNQDFNVLFNKVNLFRHYDHKFEWSRQQFEDWAQNIVQRFPDYTVEFSGVGWGSAGSEQLGACSQVAVFVHKSFICEKYISSSYTRQCICLADSFCKSAVSEGKLLCKCVCQLCVPDHSVGICTYSSPGSCSGKIKNVEYNPSFNIYYKMVQKIVYPYEIDGKSDEERLLDTLNYRIHTFGSLNSRFYIEERARCEIPVMDIMYGNIDISEHETCTLLIKSGYTIEKCLIQETQLSENCIIWVPQEMENFSGTSETSSYSSECAPSVRTESNKNCKPMSDWDEVRVDEKTAKKYILSATEPPLQTQNKPHSDSLLDSGYQKSPSPQDDSPQWLLEDLEEVDHFDDGKTTPNFASSDNRVHLKRPIKDKRLSAEAHSVKSEAVRIDDADKLFAAKTVSYGVLKALKKPPDFAIAGPSTSPKKKKVKLKCEDSIEEDAKSIANCIVQNSLNKIDVEDPAELIHYLGIIEERPVANPERAEEPQLVENGDLANNNRDDEGNNFAGEIRVAEGADHINDNVDEPVVPLQDNGAGFEDNNDNFRDDDVAVPVAQDLPAVLIVEEPLEPAIEPEEVASASKEALFDPLSERDLLQDFHQTPQADVLQDGATHEPQAASVQIGNFPGWLLQILGGYHISLESQIPMETHFYCQGDGLGVHPSVTTLEANGDADDDETTESSNNTADFAEVEPGPSDHDASSLPEESLGNSSINDESDVGRVSSPSDSHFGGPDKTHNYF